MFMLISYCRWHCDIKPPNIIYCKDGTRKGWKIGDPGFATFAEETRVRKQEGLPVVHGKGGTSAYGEQMSPRMLSFVTHISLGGPERPGGDQAPVSQRFDIWSLGCVFSEAATWVALGHRGINLFQLVRKSGQLSDDINAYYGNILETRSSISDIDDNSLIGVQGLDRFHDGSKMSSTVKDWHTHVRQTLRRCDPVTERVLEIVENSMLQADPQRQRVLRWRWLRRSDPAWPPRGATRIRQVFITYQATSSMLSTKSTSNSH